MVEVSSFRLVNYCPVREICVSLENILMVENKFVEDRRPVDLNALAGYGTVFIKVYLPLSHHATLQQRQDMFKCFGNVLAHVFGILDVVE